MKYRIEYISTFYMDILAITEFLTDYPEKASRIFAKIDRALKPLGKMPEMYPVYPDVPSYRFIVVEDYLVFYRNLHYAHVFTGLRYKHGLFHPRNTQSKAIYTSQGAYPHGGT